MKILVFVLALTLSGCTGVIPGFEIDGEVSPQERAAICASVPADRLPEGYCEKT